MENIIGEVFQFLKQFILKAQNKHETQPKRRWLLSTEHLEPATYSDEPSFPTVLPERHAFRNKARCLYEAAKHGTQEGVLAGVFFGGSWGIFKSISLKSFFTPPSAETPKNKTPKNNLSFIDHSQQPHSPDHETLSWLQTRNTSPHIREEGPRSQSATRTNSHSSEATLRPQTQRNPEFIGYAFLQTGSFDDSDGRQSDDPDQSATMRDRTQNKRKTSQSSDEATRRPSKDSKTGSCSKQPSKSNKTSAKHSQDLTSQLSKGLSSKPGASSNAGQSLAGFKDILEVSKPIRGLQDAGRSLVSVKTDSKAPITVSETSEKVLGKEKVKSSASNDPNSIQNPRLAFQSNEALIIEESRESVTSDSKATDLTESSASHQPFPQSKDSTVSNKKSGNIQPSVEILPNKRRMSNRGTTRNIWPDNDISKSILRNADSISNSYNSLTDDRRNADQLDQQEGQVGMNHNSSQILPSGLHYPQQDQSKSSVPQPETSEWILPAPGPDTCDATDSMTPSKPASMLPFTLSATKTPTPSMVTSCERTEKDPSGPPQDHLSKTNQNLSSQTPINRASSSSAAKEGHSEQIMFQNSTETFDTRPTSVKNSLEDTNKTDSSASATDYANPSCMIFGNSVTMTDSGMNKVNQSAFGSSVPLFGNPAMATGNHTSGSSPIPMAGSETSGANQDQMPLSTLTGSQNSTLVPSGTTIGAQLVPENARPAGRSSIRSTDSGQSKQAHGSNLEEFSQKKSESSGEATKDSTTTGVGSAPSSGSGIKGSLEREEEFGRVVTGSCLHGSLEPRTSAVSSMGTFRTTRNMPEIDKTTSSFIQKVSPLSDNSSRSSSVVKTTGQTSQAPATMDEENPKKFNFLSAINENIIVLSACNCALVLGLVCGVISTTKASMKL